MPLPEAMLSLPEACSLPRIQLPQQAFRHLLSYLTLSSTLQKRFMDEKQCQSPAQVHALPQTSSCPPRPSDSPCKFYPSDPAAWTTAVPPSTESSRLFQAILTSCFLSKLSNTYLLVGTFSPATLGSLSFTGALSPCLASLEASWFQEVLLPRAGARQHLLQGMEM